MEDKRMKDCWLNIDKSEGSLNSVLNMYFDENNTGANRSAKIRISTEDGGIVREFVIVQKKKEAVVYKNERQSKFFTKNTCDPETEKGERREYVVEAGKYTSLISQEDADKKALDDIERNGQQWVNDNGGCSALLWYNKEQSGEFQKNDCDPDTEEGSMVVYKVPEGTYSSTISQEDADRKAKNGVLQNGQDYANSHGKCITIKWYNVEMKKSFQKNDCLVTETGSVVEYTVPAKKYFSNISQKDADNKAKADIETNGQDYANENGTCTTDLWYNNEHRKTFTKNDCGEGYIGTEYEYVVEAGRYSSEISQEDANRKALDDIKANGQAQANLNGTCERDPNYFVGVASKVFTRNNCDSDKYGTDVTVTQDDVTGGPFISTESQDAANALAMAAVESQGQEIANSKGQCLNKPVFTGVYSADFTKNNCNGDAVGSTITVTQDDVDGGPFTSTESQKAANSLAQTAVEAQGQGIANARGNCTWTGKYSKDFQKNDCEEGQVGSTITITEADVVGGPFTSTESQAASDALARSAVERQGQAIANSRGNCKDLTVYTGRYSARFTPVCERCHEGAEIEVTAEMVNGSPVTSTISQDDADSKARQMVEEGGQAYANKNGTCNPMSTDPVWEDVVPEELRCNEGKSEKKQHDTNECSSSYNRERWVEGGNKTCQWTGVYSETFKRNDCKIADSGTEVNVTQDMCNGAPFISFVSQNDANSLAQAAVKEQGQGIANKQGECQFVGEYSAKFAKNNCGSCQHGVEMDVDQDMVGGPFYSLISQVDADAKARAAVEEQGQAYANKNGSCELDSTDPQWNDTGETRCHDGVSQKEQIDRNPCSSTHDQTQWVEGGGLTCTWTGSYSKEFTKQCADGGTGSNVTVTQDDVTGGPFISTVSQEDANSKAKAAVEAQGQAIANSEGTCEWIGQCTKQFTKNDCGTCKQGSSVNVNQDMVGGPFKSNISKADADAKACAAVDEQGQAAANKNGSCVDDDKTPNWVDTGSTQCSGCDSQKQQRDTNQCSDTYNQTRFVIDEPDSENCGSMGSWLFESCNGSTATYKRIHSCSGRTETKTEYNDPNCCDSTLNPTSEYRCTNGYSERKYESECGDTEWRREGTACTATYDCSNYTVSGSDQASEIPYDWTCNGSGTQTGSGSTTSEARANARLKCECSNYTATVNYDCTRLDDTSGSEGSCSYVCKYYGTQTGVSNTSYSTQEAAAFAATLVAQKKCQCSKTYTFSHDRAASNQECKERCPYGGISNDTHIKTSGTGSTCAAAEKASSDNWFNELDENYSKYCNCNDPTGVIQFSISETPYIYQIVSAKIEVKAEVGSKTVNLTGSKELNGIVGSARDVSGKVELVPTGTAVIRQNSFSDPTREIKIQCAPSSFMIDKPGTTVVQISPANTGASGIAQLTLPSSSGTQGYITVTVNAHNPCVSSKVVTVSGCCDSTCKSKTITVPANKSDWTSSPLDITLGSACSDSNITAHTNPTTWTC